MALSTWDGLHEGDIFHSIFLLDRCLGHFQLHGGERNKWFAHNALDLGVLALEGSCKVAKVAKIVVHKAVDLGLKVFLSQAQGGVIFGANVLTRGTRVESGDLTVSYSSRYRLRTP